jgi:hypothetical protein
VVAGFYERVFLGVARVQNILGRYVVANLRTLENKISDAGPTNQRINPHILTVSLQTMRNGNLVDVYRKNENSTPWYYLKGLPDELLKPRLAELEPIYDQTQTGTFKIRVGQALEIAVSKALQSQNNFVSIGHFRDLNEHGDEKQYSKEEPPDFVNEKTCKGKLDFLLFDREAGTVGVEVKNVREWYYSDREEVKAMLSKCCALDAVPVLICRRYAYEAYSVLTDCGVILHQTCNQRYANADGALAEEVKDKNLLGYHDVRVGSDPDERLVKFIHTNLPAILPEAREKFDKWKDTVAEYAANELDFSKFLARIRGREYEREEPYSV